MARIELADVSLWRIYCMGKVWGDACVGFRLGLGTGVGTGERIGEKEQTHVFNLPP